MDDHDAMPASTLAPHTCRVRIPSNVKPSSSVPASELIVTVEWDAGPSPAAKLSMHARVVIDVHADVAHSPSTTARMVGVEARLPKLRPQIVTDEDSDDGLLAVGCVVGSTSW